MAGHGLFAHGPRNPADLYRRLLALHTGFSLYYDYSTLVVSAGSVTSWTARVGSNLTAAGSPSFGLERLQNFPGLSSNTTGVASLNGSFTSTVELWAVAGGSPVVGDQGILFRSQTSLGLMARISGGSTFYTANGWAHNIDGTNTETVPTTGTHVFKGVGPAASGNCFVAGQSDSGAQRCWKSPILLLFGRSTTSDAATTTATLKILRSFFRL